MQCGPESLKLQYRLTSDLFRANIRILCPIRGLNRTTSPSNHDHEKGHSSTIRPAPSELLNPENATTVPFAVCFKSKVDVRLV